MKTARMRERNSTTDSAGAGDQSRDGVGVSALARHLAPTIVFLWRRVGRRPRKMASHQPRQARAGQRGRDAEGPHRGQGPGVRPARLPAVRPGSGRRAGRAERRSPPRCPAPGPGSRRASSMALTLVLEADFAGNPDDQGRLPAGQEQALAVPGGALQDADLGLHPGVALDVAGGAAGLAGGAALGSHVAHRSPRRRAWAASRAAATGTPPSRRPSSSRCAGVSSTAIPMTMNSPAHLTALGRFSVKPSGVELGLVGQRRVTYAGRDGEGPLAAFRERALLGAGARRDRGHRARAHGRCGCGPTRSSGSSWFDARNLVFDVTAEGSASETNRFVSGRALAAFRWGGLQPGARYLEAFATGGRAGAGPVGDAPTCSSRGWPGSTWGTGVRRDSQRRLSMAAPDATSRHSSSGPSAWTCLTRFIALVFQAGAAF